MTPSEKAHALRDAIPPGGLFADKSWRISPDPFPLSPELHRQLIELGPRLHSFNKACNLLYRQSIEGKQPSWIHEYLDAGKPAALLETARHKQFKNDLPCVIRPDVLLTEDGLAITELDSVPGGIGLTAWLQQAYQQPPAMLKAFAAALAPKSQISNLKSQIALVVSDEAAAYRPEMEWLASANLKFQISNFKFLCCRAEDLEYRDNGVFLHNEPVAVIYRFFELFDLSNIANADKLIHAAAEGHVHVTPPFKPFFEEKLWFALFWFPQLADFWRRELGDRYFRDLQPLIPFTWLMDPSPLPPHAVIPHLNIHDWSQLSNFSQKQRDLILKISGFSERAWGSRGVFLGSDMSGDDWKKEVTRALGEFKTHPHILQRFAKTKLVEHAWHNFEKNEQITMKGRLRLCPYYFVQNDKPDLGGILATICPADKKLIHGMQDAILTLATH